jgi:hypothetical protein
MMKPSYRTAIEKVYTVSTSYMWSIAQPTQAYMSDPICIAFLKDQIPMLWHETLCQLLLACHGSSEID